MDRLHPSAQWPESSLSATVSIVRGYLYEVASDDFCGTTDPTVGTHGFNSAGGTLSVVPLALLDGSATIYVRPDGRFLVRN